MPYLTPTTGEGETSLAFDVPYYLMPYLTGALFELCDFENWEQYGDLTPEETAALFSELLAVIIGV